MVCRLCTALPSRCLYLVPPCSFFHADPVTMGTGAPYSGSLSRRISRKAGSVDPAALVHREVQSCCPEPGKIHVPTSISDRGHADDDCRRLRRGRLRLRRSDYSYWRNMNNHVDSNEILIFLGLNKAMAGRRSTLFSYDKSQRK